MVVFKVIEYNMKKFCPDAKASLIFLKIILTKSSLMKEITCFTFDLINYEKGKMHKLEWSHLTEEDRFTRRNHVIKNRKFT